MNPDWEYALPSMRQSRMAQDSNICESMRNGVATACTGHRTSTPALSKFGRATHSTRSAQGLATVGLGSFKINELHAMIKAIPGGEEDGFCTGGLIPVPDSFQGLNAEEYRPPRELFAWGQERIKRSDMTDSADPCGTSPTICSPQIKSEYAANSLPSLHRSASVAGWPCTLSGIKCKGLATTGGEALSRRGRTAVESRRRVFSGGVTSSTLRKNYLAVRGTEGMWQFTNRARNVRETPASRGDAFALLREFEAAMAVLENLGSEAEGHVGAFGCPMQNDMNSLQQEVGKAFGNRTAVREAVQIMDQVKHGEGDIGDCGRDKHGYRLNGKKVGLDLEKSAETLAGDEGGCEINLTAEWVSNAVGFSPEDWSSMQSILGDCLFEQKWLDLTCGELCEQVSVTCLPHGQLLQEIRRRSASVFNRFHGLYSDLLWVLDRCVESVLRGKRYMGKSEENWARKLADTHAEHEANIKAIHDSHGFKEEEQARAKREAKVQVDRMGDTLRTLNGIFKTMQADGKAMTEVDLKDRCRALEQDLSARKEETREFRALKKKHIGMEAEMQAMKAELTNSKLREARVKEEMERRKALMQELMDNEARRLTEIEALRAEIDAVGGGNSYNGMGDGGGGGQEDTKPDARSREHTNKLEKRSICDITAIDTGESNKRSGTGGDGGDGRAKGAGNDGKGRGVEYDIEEEYEEEVGSSVLCIKCRKALDDLSNIADALEKEKEVKGQMRLLCHGYRLLLPNLKGYRPPRTVSWVRTVMRAVLRAKVWDDSVLRYKQEIRMRFPEFTYSWFEPPRAAMAATNPKGRSKLVAQANDDRWALYYGVKSLARENAEATIFWHALNETNGEDYLTFLVYCLSIIEGTAGGMLRDQWGVHDTCTDLHTLKRRLGDVGLGQECGSSEDGDDPRGGPNAEIHAEANEAFVSGKDVVWLLSSDAVEAVNHVLVKALEDQKRKVLKAAKAISVSCQGRLPDQDPSSTCVDLFLFLRIMLHSFKEEQVNRRAAVRLMFETVATGVLTDGTPIYGNGVVDQSVLSSAETAYNSLVKESKATVDLPQFMLIARTLWPEVSTSEAVTLFRDAHEETNGEVDYQAFLALADRWQFFSNALQLPVHMPSRADLGHPGLDIVTKENLGALVHCHYSLMQPTVESVKETLPESAVKQLVKCQRALERELRGASTWTTRESAKISEHILRSSESAGGVEDPNKKTRSLSLPLLISIDGTKPLAAYRRLLSMMYHVRNVRHESGPGYELPTEKGMHVVQKTEAEFRAFEAVFFDLKTNPRFQTYKNLREMLAATRVQRTWRRKLSRSCDVPLGMLELFRPGFLRRIKGIISKTVHHPPYWTQQHVAEAYTAKLRADSQNERNGLLRRGASLGPPSRPLFWVTFNHLLRQWGTPELAERAAHDLFFNVRSLAPALSRLRLFGAFSGCFPPEEPGIYYDDDIEFHDEEALAFYLRSVVTFHRIREDMKAVADAAAAATEKNTGDTGMQQDGVLQSLGTTWEGAGEGEGDGDAFAGLNLSAMMGDAPKAIDELFPVTLQDPNTGRQYWHERVEVAEAVAKELFDKCSQPPPLEKTDNKAAALTTSRVSDVQMSLGKLLGHPVLREGKNGLIDVDDVLWLFMRHWLVGAHAKDAKQR